MARCAAVTGSVTAVAVAGPAASRLDHRLPDCPPGIASTRPPTEPAGPQTPAACQAAANSLSESTVSIGRLRTTPNPGGYLHLGAGTAGEWSGVSGRMSVVDASVRQSTYDFAAGRFMVKRDLGGGSIAWLEAGWAETGWSGAGRQRIYTFNTNSKTWQFYDQYALKAGDKVWLEVRTDADNIWQAWLWWNNRWNLLTRQKLPIGSSAYVEQYVEIYSDPKRPARVDVPPVTVDNVQLLPPGGGNTRYWRDDVNTLTASGPQQRIGDYCLDWITPYDTWTAGNCSKPRVAPIAP